MTQIFCMQATIFNPLRVRDVNTKLCKIYEWLSADESTLNAKTSSYVIFHPYQKKIDHQITLKTFDNDTKMFVPLDQKGYVKYFGVLIDSNLTWKYHYLILPQKLVNLLVLLPD